MVAGPIIWIIEDEAPQGNFIARTLSAMYGNALIRHFSDADTVLTACTVAMDADLIVLDLAIPPGRAGLSTLPGLDVLQTVRATNADSYVLVRTGLSERVVPVTLLDSHTQLTLKGDSPERFLLLASSFLALRGFPASRAPTFVTPSLPVAGGPEWLGAGVVLGAVPAAAGIWVASVLQVTSNGGPGFNALMVALGIAGGLMMAASRFLGSRKYAAGVLLAGGSALTLAVSLLIPPLA